MPLSETETQVFPLIAVLATRPKLLIAYLNAQDAPLIALGFNAGILIKVRPVFQGVDALHFLKLFQVLGTAGSLLAYDPDDCPQDASIAGILKYLASVQ
jgi:hypothetical protein